MVGNRFDPRMARFRDKPLIFKALQGEHEETSFLILVSSGLPLTD
ncbi:MAG: hypothetical protein ACRDRW_13880 [Pseudonocardiaceae bacterium]